MGDTNRNSGCVRADTRFRPKDAADEPRLFRRVNLVSRAAAVQSGNV